MRMLFFIEFLKTYFTLFIFNPNPNPLPIIIIIIIIDKEKKCSSHYIYFIK
jgi:hypothetical protein